MLGNGTLVGEYIRQGNKVTVWINLTMGSTTTYGTGSWEFTLPVTMGAAGRFIAGAAQMLQSGVADFIGVTRGDNTTSRLRVITSAGDTVNSTKPFVWANTHVLVLTFEYYTP